MVRFMEYTFGFIPVCMDAYRPDSIFITSSQFPNFVWQLLLQLLSMIC